MYFFYKHVVSSYRNVCSNFLAGALCTGPPFFKRIFHDFMIVLIQNMDFFYHSVVIYTRLFFISQLTQGLVYAMI